ncbi:MAG: hypothetical protein WB439_00965 [Acidobacteriaceae bacterium]
MRLELPTRISLPKTFIFLSVFFCVQRFEHTNLFFSLLYFAFVVLSVVAFNLAEGFSRLTGAYIFWYSTLIVIVGVTWKAMVGEPADSHLFSPLLDMSLYVASMLMLLLVTLLNRKMDFRSIGVGGGFSSAELNYTGAGLGCLIMWFGIIYADEIFGQAPGSLVSALVQVNVFGQLGLILATIGAMKDSGGRRSTNTISIVAFSYFGYLSLISVSKQAAITPMVCWVVGVVYARLQVRFVHIVAVICMAAVSFGFISPLSASRDLFEGLDNVQHLQLEWFLLFNPKVLREHVAQLDVNQESTGVGEWYDKPQGSLIERLSMIPPDDELLDYSSEGHYEGMAPIYQYFGNLAPHFINPHKYISFSGNYYAHEMGYGVGVNDYSTGISFSPVAEAYHCEGWGGIFWLLPVIWIMLFTSADFVVGDMSKYPWGLMVVVWFAHLAPEQLVGGMIYFLGYGNFGMFFAIVVVTRIAPILGALFIGKTASPPARRTLNRVGPALAQARS